MPSICDGSRRTLPSIAFAIFATCSPATAQGAQPQYLDDRSTPEAVVESLYNAIERQEYLRAWSYFRDEPGRPSFEAFAKGYEATAHARVKLGEGSSDGAAGSIYYAVPAVVEATGRDGGIQVYAGCYELRLVQPAAQATPPFQPLGIVKGVLKPASAGFDAASGSCAGLP